MRPFFSTLFILFSLIFILAFEDGILVFEEYSVPEEVLIAQDKFNKNFNIAPYKDLGFQIIVSILDQKLYLTSGEKIIKKYSISSAKNGVGEVENSYKTPTGTHRIIEKFGEDGPKFGIYMDRKFTGKIAEIIQDERDVETDYITSRILWIDGLETHNKNSKDRYIYIHGTHEEGLIGKPMSHGCIRMKNDDIIELYKFVPINTLVEIIP